jgi:hypothetical protein
MKPARLTYTSIATAAAIMIILSAAAKAPPTKAAPFVPLIAPDAKANSADMGKMFQAAYGKPAPALRTVNEEEYAFSPHAVQSLEPHLVALISMGQNESAGHAQSGMNAIHYLRKTPAGYKVIGEYMGVGVAGTFGQPALRYALTKKLGKNPYFITQAGGTWQGYTCESTSLTELTPAKAVDRGSFASGYSNSGAVSKRRDQQDIDGMITAAVPDKSFTVTFSGTRKFSQTWVRGATEYGLKGEDELPAC